MRRNENFILRRVADMSVIVPLGAAAEAFPGMISVNETGAFLWDLLEQEQNNSNYHTDKGPYKIYQFHYLPALLCFYRNIKNTT